MKARDLLNTREPLRMGHVGPMAFLARRTHRDAVAAERRAQQRAKTGNR